MKRKQNPMSMLLLWKSWLRKQDNHLGARIRKISGPQKEGATFWGWCLSPLCVLQFGDLSRNRTTLRFCLLANAHNPQTWESETGDLQFQCSLGYLVRSHIKINSRQEMAHKVKAPATRSPNQKSVPRDPWGGRRSQPTSCLCLHIALWHILHTWVLNAIRVLINWIPKVLPTLNLISSMTSKPFDPTITSLKMIPKASCLAFLSSASSRYCHFFYWVKSNI